MDMGLTTAFAGLVAVAGVAGAAAVVPAAAIPAASTAASGATLLSTGSSVVPAGFAAALPDNPADGAAATGRVTAIAISQSTATGATPAAAQSRLAAQPPPPAASAATATSPPAPRCDDGNWRGPDGVNVNGRPDNFDAGDRGAVYLWHGPDGWHLRTTDISDTAHHYTGTIALSAGARFTSFAPTRLENDDRVWVDGENVLHYDFTTYDGIDGVDWTVSACDGARDHEAMRFSMDVNGREDDPSRIDLGDTKQQPDSASFYVIREA